jgi:hypothetical protein
MTALTTEARRGVAPGWSHWTKEETARLDDILRTRYLSPQDMPLFPDRTEDAVRRKASKRRIRLGIAEPCRGRPARKERGFDMEQPERQGPTWEEKAAASSEALLRATVTMCIRRGITLPGLSAGHTRALAVNLGLAA